MSLTELIILAIGLAMDAFAVSLCGSMVLAPQHRTKGALNFGLWFGLFQGLMPLIGYFSALHFTDYIVAYDHWIAFGLLAYLGINMIKEAGEEADVKESYSCKEMLVLALATSIDALAVGISLACLSTNIWLAAGLIGLITFIIATFGGLMGFRLGSSLGQRANIFGGFVLLCIGTKILLEHTGIL